MNFRGRSLRNLDPKGRLMLPPEYRENLHLRMFDNNKEQENVLNAEQEFIKTESKPIVTTESESIVITEPIIITESESIITAEPNAILLKKESIQEVKFFVTTYDNCLVAFSWNDWLTLEKQFAKLMNPSPKLRSLRRLFIGGAEEQVIDSQGRIRLSAYHKEYAKLEKEVTILGLTTRFEIWNPTLLKASIENQCLDDVTEELSSSGIDFAL